MSLILPADGNTTTSSSVAYTFSYNVTENLEINNCSLIINNIVDSTNSSITDLSAIHYFTKTLTPGNYNWSVNCTDAANNGDNSSTRNIIITAPASEDVVSTSGGGGGGSGGGGSGVSYKVNYIIDSASSEDPINISVNNANIPISAMFIEVNKELENIKLKIEALQDEPEVETLEGEVYQYLEITPTDFSNADIDYVVIEFDVNQSWLNEKGFSKNDIVLMRYNNKWEELETSYLKRDSDLHHYASISPGFSYFAIVALSDVIVEEEEEFYYPEEEELIVGVLNEEERELGSNKNLWWVWGLIGLLIILGLMLWLRLKNLT